MFIKNTFNMQAIICPHCGEKVYPEKDIPELTDDKSDTYHCPLCTMPVKNNS